jgi:hypothetical protein
MKFLSILLLALFGQNSLAAISEDLILLPEQYQIVKDEFDSTISKDKFVIEGDVMMFSSMNPIDKCLVGCTASAIWVRTDKEGRFTVELEATDSIVYFYIEGWSEVVIETYRFQAQHRIQLEVYLIQNAKPVRLEQNLKRKPVIYLYSDKDVEIDLKLDPLGEFVFTYPEYNDGWKVKIVNNQIIVDDKSYPYLFWEGKSENIKYSYDEKGMDGFLIAKEEVVPFLEKSLNELGFNSKEKTDFITYWGPILERKSYALVQFVFDDEYDSEIGKLDMKPAALASKRVFIKCSNLDDANLGFDLIDQEFKKIDRKGLTLVEWGGAIIDLNNLGH